MSFGLLALVDRLWNWSVERPSFSDVIVFRSPPAAIQRALFGAVTPVARWRGYRATYPQLSRTVLAPPS